MSMQNFPVSWFEIPVRKLERAQKFYETVLATTLRREDMGPMQMAMFGQPDSAVGGCLLAGEGTPDPATHGTLVYLNAAPSLDAALARVEAAGGRIVTPKVALPDGMGVFAHVSDTEGNRVGLYAAA
jgi:uncharacterized protein